MMKNIILLSILTLALGMFSCKTTYRTYAHGDYYDSVVDSINNADNVNIPDTAVWRKTSFLSNKGVMYQYLYMEDDLTISVHKTPSTVFLYRYSNIIKKRLK